MSEKLETTLDEQGVVTKNAKPGDPMPKSETGTPGQGIQDLGGPTPFNSKPDDDSNKMKTGGGPTATPPQTKPSDASGQKAEFSTKGDVHASHEPEGEVIEEEQEEETIQVDLSADVAALTEGEDLSEEFKAKAATIFEAAVISRLNEELGRMHDDYAKVLEEEIESVKTELAEKVDEYLSFATNKWAKDNALAIEHGIKTEMAESVLAGLKQVFSENYIEVPEEKVDLVDEMTSQLDTMEEKLNSQIEENVTLTKEIGGYIKNGIVTELADGLSVAQKEKFASLTDAVEFENEESFREKVKTIRESYFNDGKPATTTVTEDVEVDPSTQVESGTMSAYVNALSRWAK
jgi:ribosomal protein S13